MFLRSRVNDDMLINVSSKVLKLLMNRTSKLAAEVLVELTWHSIRDSLIAFLDTETIHNVAERSRSRIDRLELSDQEQPADQ